MQNVSKCISKTINGLNNRIGEIRFWFKDGE